jgi:hypothetical protein
MDDFKQTGQQALAGFDAMQGQLDRLFETTDILVGGPLDKLIDGMVKAGTSSQTASKSLEKFAEDMLTTFTKKVTESVFEGLSDSVTATGGKKGQADKAGAGQAVLGALFGEVFSNHPMGGGPVALGAGSPVNVTVYNNSTANATVQERTNSQGQREIEIMLDNMVAQSLTRGRQTRSVLRSVFGIDNLLSSR